MKSHVVKIPNDNSFERVGVKGKVFPVETVSERTGICLIETEGGHETTIIEHKCDFIYYVLEGDGSFVIDGNTEACTKGDLVIVPAGAKFRYIGKLKMLLISTPMFYPEQEETL